MLFRGFILASAIALANGGCGGCSSDGFHLDAPGLDANTVGRVSLAWKVTDLAGQPIACDDVGANTVAVQLHSRNSLSGAAASFSCTNSPSTTQALLSGIYDVSFELHGAGGTLATAPDQIGIVVSPGQDTQLTPVAFPVDARGGLVLSIAVPAAASNCPSPPAGAGITSTTITLVHASGSCAPVTFKRFRGTTPMGTYMANCSGLSTPCLETNETLVVDSLPSGPYTIHILGKITSFECWKNDDPIQVPAQGKPLIRTFNLAHQEVPGC